MYVMHFVVSTLLFQLLSKYMVQIYKNLNVTRVQTHTQPTKNKRTIINTGQRVQLNAKRILIDYTQSLHES